MPTCLAICNIEPNYSKEGSLSPLLLMCTQKRPDAFKNKGDFKESFVKKERRTNTNFGQRSKPSLWARSQMRNIICFSFSSVSTMVEDMFVYLDDPLDLITLQKTKNDWSYFGERNDNKHSTASFTLLLSPSNILSVMKNIKTPTLNPKYFKQNKKTETWKKLKKIHLRNDYLGSGL